MKNLITPWLFLAFLVICTSWCRTMQAQVLIIPSHQQSEVFFFDHLFQVSLVNSTNQNIEGLLEIDIESRTRQQVIKITSPQLHLQAGAIMQSHEIAWSNQIELGQLQFISGLVETGKLPYGEYVFCYRFIATDGQILGVNCQEKSIKTYGQPELISPYDNETIVVKQPILTWKAPLPLISTKVTYDLKLTQIHVGQTPAQALQTNFPLLQEKGLNRTFLAYPSHAYPLEKEQDYVWQIHAYYEGIPLGATEIWQFRISDIPSQEKEDKQESYRFAKNKLGASYYLATDILRLAYDNRLNEKILSYGIYLEENAKNKIKEVPKVDLKPGINTLDIDISRLSELRDGKQYVLQIKDKIGKKHYFKFKYQKKK